MITDYELKKGRIYLVSIIFKENDNDLYLSYPDFESFLEDAPRLRRIFPDFTWSGMYIKTDELSKFITENLCNTSDTLPCFNELEKKLSVLEQDYQRLNDYLNIVDSALYRLNADFVNSLDRDNTLERLCKSIGYFQGQLYPIEHRLVYASPEALYNDILDNYKSDSLTDDLPF